MTQLRPEYSSFNGGELSPLMAGRSDTRIYAIGAAEMVNFAPCIEGPMQKCPGFVRVRAAAASSTWLTPFVFNTTQSYVLECLDEAVRFYTNGGRIETAPNVPYEVAVPFAADEWPRVSMQQSFDRLYMAHAAHAPGALTRTDAVTFEWAALNLQRGPFKAGNADESIVVTVTGTLTVDGTVTVTATDPIFQPGHAGALFQVEARDFRDVPAWEVAIDGVVSGTTRVRSDGKVYLAASSGRAGTVTPTHEEGTEWDGRGEGEDINEKGPYGVQWTYQHDRFGVIRLTTIAGDGLSATGTVVRRVPSSLATAASWKWAHGAFSDAEGWPNLVFVWNERLCFWKGFELYGSVVGDFLNFQQYSSSGLLTADLAFRLVLAAPDPPVWVAVDRELVVGTASAEWVIGAVNAAAGISAGNLRASRQSTYGTAPVWPVEPGASVVFIQRGGKQFREAQYDFGSDRYQASNINRWARHIAGRAGIVQLGQQASPEELLFAVRGDGQLVLRSYDPEQEVKGFSRRVLAQDGRVISAVAVPSPDGASDEIWALCEWEGARSVQQMAAWWTPGNAIEDAIFVDDALFVARDTPSASVTGLTHLAGATVTILADGGVCPPQTVPDTGTITLPYAARKVAVGRGYAARYRALRPEGESVDGRPVRGLRRQLKQMMLRLLDSAGLYVGAPGSQPESVLDRRTTAPMDAPVPLFTGDTPLIAVPDQWQRDGSFEITTGEHDPRPAFVISAMPKVEVGG